MYEGQKLKATVKQIVAVLVRGDYVALEAQTNGVRLPAAEMAEAIRRYGRTLLMPPESAFESLEIYEVEGRRPEEWRVDIDLWTAEEGPSDLTLQLTLRESSEAIYEVEIDDIHVL